MRAPKGRVKEEITPRGDGNDCKTQDSVLWFVVKEEITPRGDGNCPFSWYARSRSG